MMKRASAKQRFLAVLVVLAAAVLRILTLPSVGCLSFDEAWSVWIAQKSFGPAMEVVLHDKHPPLFYVLLYAWIRMVGISEFSLRMLSALAGVAGVAALYRAGREMFDHATGLVAALVMAISPFQIWYSQQARMYPLALVFSLLSVLLLWKARDRNSADYWLAYAIFTLAAVSIHYMAGLVLIGQGAFLAFDTVRHRERAPVLGKWLLSLLVLGVVALPWLPRLVSQIRIDSGPPPWIAEMHGSPNLKALFDTLFKSFLLFDPHIYPSRPLRLLTYLTGMTLFALSVVKPRAQPPFFQLTVRTAEALCLFCLALPIGTVWLLSQPWPMYVPRYLLPFSGFMYLLIARGIRRVPTRAGSVLAAVILVGILATGSARLPRWQRERDWDAIANYVLAHWQDDDVAVITPLANWIVFDYYTKGRIPENLAFYRRLYPSYPEPPTEEELSSTLLQEPLRYRRLWWIDEHGTGLAAEWEADPEQTVRRFLDQHFAQQDIPRELTSRWGNVLLYQLTMTIEADR